MYPTFILCCGKNNDLILNNEKVKKKYTLVKNHPSDRIVDPSNCRK